MTETRGEQMTVKEAQEYLGVSSTTMAKLLRTGVLASERDPLDTRHKLIKRADLDALLARSKRGRDTAAAQA